ncbi:hypothetical protein L0337_19750 [candidate division KSB1 bacterium]|nr:hypothetical protein [candidate division KSB1 bacterium]
MFVKVQQKLVERERLRAQEHERALKAWSIQILAQVEALRDSENIVVVFSTTSKEWNKNDHPCLPINGEYVSVYVSHTEWEKFASNDTLDALSERSDGEVWEFEVKTNIRDKVNLIFNRLKSVPEEFEIWLLDEAMNVTQNLRETNHYVLARVGVDLPKQFKLVVGKSDFITKSLPRFR